MSAPEFNTAAFLDWMSAAPGWTMTQCRAAAAEIDRLRAEIEVLKASQSIAGTIGQHMIETAFGDG